MAVTQGHGNPAWAEDEIILALDLYFELGAIIPDSSNPKVQALSELLRSLPYHANAAREPSFRNAAGVAFKLQNLRSVATGKGLKNTSKADKSIWKRWGNDPIGTRERAQLIRASIQLDLPGDTPTEPVDDEVFAEGLAITRAHQKRERNPKLRKKLLKKRSEDGALHCDICGFRNQTGDPRFDDAGLEAHHLQPLSEIGETSTRITDLALLCATCHRLVHRAIRVEGNWLSIKELQAILTPSR